MDTPPWEPKMSCGAFWAEVTDTKEAQSELHNSVCNVVLLMRKDTYTEHCPLNMSVPERKCTFCKGALQTDDSRNLWERQATSASFQTLLISQKENVVMCC